MKYIVYKTTCLKNNKIYIGVHGTQTDDFDGYLGNGIYITSLLKKPSTKFKKAVKKYGASNFKRETLFEFPGTEEGKILAYKKEAELVNREFLKRKDVYNMVLGGKIPSSINEEKVAQYDMDGKFIKWFYSIKEAALATDISKSGIQYACANNTYCRGFQWRYYTTSDDIKEATLKTTTVYQFDLQGNYITYFKSISLAASELNISVKDIQATCAGKQRQAHGYYWSYKKQFNYQVPLNNNIAVACYNDNGKFITSYTSLRQAEELTRINRGSIINCIKGKSKHAGNLRWRYFYGNTSDIKSL